jgi:hypothetical protein
MERYFTNFDSHSWLFLACGNPHKIMSRKLRGGEEGRLKPKGKGKGECHGCAHCMRGFGRGFVTSFL